jgi:hypothetical protein
MTTPELVARLREDMRWLPGFGYDAVKERVLEACRRLEQEWEAP